MVYNDRLILYKINKRIDDLGGHIQEETFYKEITCTMLSKKLIQSELLEFKKQLSVIRIATNDEIPSGCYFYLDNKKLLLKEVKGCKEVNVAEFMEVIT